MSARIRILVADDHHLVREGVLLMLAQEDTFEVVGEAANGREAIRLCQMLQPDVLLLDLDMPEMNGLEAATQLRKDMPELRIGILTMHQEKILIEKMIQLGINGYLFKTSDAEELIEGIKKIASGKNFYTAQVTENLVKSNPIFRQASAEYTVLLSQLSPREREILILIAEGKSSSAIGEQLHISPRTVETHRANLLRKLEVNNLAGLIRIAIKSGLVS
ncbi:MAG: response regulator transcription factor [Bacteroidota bacterium]